MIVGMTTINAGDLAMVGLLVVGMVLLGRLGWLLIDLLAAGMHHADGRELLDEYADDIAPYAGFDDDTVIADVVGLPGDRQHTWSGMAPLLDDGPRPLDDPAVFQLDSVPDVIDGAVGPCGRHCVAEGRVSVDEVTGYVKTAALIPTPVEDTQTMAAVAAVSGQDGAA